MKDILVCFYEAKHFYYKNVVSLLTGNTEFAKVRAFCAHVPTCFHALNYYVPTCPHLSRAYLLRCLYIFFRAFVL